MRRALAFLLSLTLLGTAGLVFAHRAVAATAETVEMRETLLCGDSAAARGIKARVPTYSAEHLFWDTEMETAPDSVPVTEFRFSAAREYPGGRGWYMGLNINVMINMGGGGNFGKDFDFDEEYDDYVGGYYAVYGALLRDVASRTAPGEEHTEYVKLSDWIDYLPLEFDFSLPGYIYVYDNGEESIETNRGFTDPMAKKLAEYFRIPLPGPSTVNVRVGRNTDGEIVEWNISSGIDLGEFEPGATVDPPDLPVDPMDMLDVNLGSLSVVTDDACYFIFEQWRPEDDSGRIDFSVLPGGRGIYRLPIENMGEDGSVGDVTRVYIDKIETVLPVADDEDVELLDSDGERLLLFTVENGKLYLTQAPLSELTDVRKTELTELADSVEDWRDGCDRAVQSDGLYFLETRGGRVLLLESVGGGDYELVLDVPRDFPGEAGSVENMLWEKDICQSYDNYSTALLWDGERFAIARWCGKDSSGFYGAVAGFVLWVYDRTGLLYCGVYETSLSRSPTEMYHNIVRSAGDLELAWK